MEMDIKEPITQRQVGMVSHLMTDHKDRLPEGWKNRVGYRDGDCDWRLWNMERWLEIHLSKQEASDFISAMQDGDDAAITVLTKFM